MNTYPRRREKGRNPWNWKPYPGRDRVIAGVMIHATRSGQAGPVYDDGPGTEQWGMNPNNGSRAQGWGTYWDALIYRDGTQVISTDWDREFASWTAGYGDSGTWAAGHYYIMIEVSQSRIDQPYSAESVDSLAQLVAEASRRYSFPIERIPYLAQVGMPPPRGIATHEGSANGRKSGKTDPGPLFPWAEFLAKARAYAAGEEEWTVENEERLARLERLVAGNGTLDGDGNLLQDDAALALADRQGYSAMLAGQEAKASAALANQRLDNLPSGSDPAAIREGEPVKLVRA